MSENAAQQIGQPRGGRIHSLLPAAIFALAAFCAVFPLVLHGVSCGHDFDFHLLNWMEAASQWQHGLVKPVWALTPAFNAGEPRLLMYPPLSWITGAALELLLPWSAVPAAFTALVLFLCGLTMHRLLRRWTAPSLAVFGGCLYMVNPYMLFVAYERTAYGELLAAAWMPLLLAAMLRTRLTAPRVAAVVALLWLSNAPAAVIGCYSILLLGVGRLLLMRGEGLRGRLRMAMTVSSGVLLGLLVDAFYLIPMGWERRFVQLELAVVPLARPDRNFLFAQDPDAFHTHVLMQASWIGVATCTIALVCGAILLFLQRRTTAPVHAYRSMHMRDAQTGGAFTDPAACAVLLGFSVVVLFLLSRWSAAVWHMGPELVFLQFPWRFLVAESAVAAALLTLLLQRSFQRFSSRILIPVALVIALLAGYFAGGRYFRESCEVEESVQAQRGHFLNEEGVKPTDEYTPVIADNDALQAHLPAAWMAIGVEDEPGHHPDVPRLDRTQPEDLHFAVQAAIRPSFLIVRLRQFPGWHTLRDGVEIQPRTRPDGLIAVPLSPGAPHVVEVLYRTTTDQWAGLGVTGMALLACGIAAGRRRSGIMRPSA
ncbi:MAG: hypothetical protein ACRYGF_10905 [Janthinobacterium lividum]